MLGLCVYGSVIVCVMFYFSMDPLKSSMYLVISLILISFVISFGVCVWYSYYICLVFLSGVFVIMVYFSSLSNMSFFFVPLKVVVLVMVVLVVVGFLSGVEMEGLSSVYYDVYFFVFVYVICSLVFFLVFVSSFLVWEGALRSM